LLALATLAVLRQSERTAAAHNDAHDPHSPWGGLSGWRLNRDAFVDIMFAGRAVRAHFEAGGFVLDLPQGAKRVEGSCDAEGAIFARLDGRTLSARAVFRGDALVLFAEGKEARYTLVDPLAAAQDQGGDQKLVAPMPGQVTKLCVKLGDAVEKGTPLIVIEAMKMEHTISAPRAGKVAKLPFGVGDIVPESAELLTLDDAQ
jgi:3-methylcrotonyl-CoA carboxylase alpha subunit